MRFVIGFRGLFTLHSTLRRVAFSTQGRQTIQRGFMLNLAPIFQRARLLNTAQSLVQRTYLFIARGNLTLQLVECVC